MKSKEYPTLIRLEKSDRLEDVADQYIKHMQQGFTLTMEEMANTLKINYNTAQQKIAPHIKHIVINNQGRIGLFRYEKESEFRYLFTKRKLFLREDFDRYLLEHGEIVYKMERFDWNDFSERAREKIRLVAKDEEEAIYLIRKIALDAPEKLNPYEEKVEPLLEVPDELLGIHDLIGRYSPNKREVYKHIQQHAIPRIRIGTFIRYRKADFEERAHPPLFVRPAYIRKKPIIDYIEKRILNGQFD
jgi:hypothetical protein